MPTAYFRQNMDVAKDSDQHRRMRRVAFIAVVVSTTAIVASTITLPLVYNYVQSLQSHLAGELHFCRAKSRDMWQRAIQAAGQHGDAPQWEAMRQKREWLFGQWIDSAADKFSAGGGAAGSLPGGGSAGPTSGTGPGAGSGIGPGGSGSPGIRPGGAGSGAAGSLGGKCEKISIFINFSVKLIFKFK